MDRVPSPRVSVIVPCRDGGRWLPETLRAVLGQAFADIEVLVVDDGSEDDSWSVAAAFAGRDERVTVLSAPGGSEGPAAARAAGVAVARAPVLWFLDADDVPHADVVDRVVGHLDAHPEVGSVVLAIRLVDVAGRATNESGGWGPWWVPTRFGLREMRRGERRVHPVAILASACLISSSLCCRRATYEAAGGWRPEHGQGYEDQDLALRLALCAPMERLPEAVVDYRIHPGQFTAAGSETLRRNERRFLARWRERAAVPEAWLPAVDEAFALYDRRVMPRIAFGAARRHARAREPWTAGRFVLGALRIWLRSHLQPVTSNLR